MKQKTFEMNGWKIDSAEVLQRVTDHMYDTTDDTIDDVLVGFETPNKSGAEFEFTGNAWDGIAIHDSGAYFMVYPTLEEYKQNKELHKVVEFETGSKERASLIDFHDLCMCFGILFVTDNKMFNKL